MAPDPGELTQARSETNITILSEHDRVSVGRVSLRVGAVEVTERHLEGAATDAELAKVSKTVRKGTIAHFLLRGGSEAAEFVSFDTSTAWADYVEDPERDPETGSSSHRHRCPGGTRPGSAGRHAMRRPSSNSTTWFSRTLPRVSVIRKTCPTARTR